MKYEEYRSRFIADTFDMMNKIVNLSDNLTPIEGIMYLELCMIQMILGSLNFKIYQQHKIDKYRADFYIEYRYAFTKRKPLNIIIECDGHDFHEKTKEQVAKDKERDRFFTTNGYHVLRYSGSEIVMTVAEKVHKDLFDLIAKPE